MKKYKLELTKKQLSVIQEACEFMSRFSAGQLNSFSSSLEGYLWNKWENDDVYFNRKKCWEKHLNAAKQYMFDLPINASLGINNPELTEEAKICYDIYRPILELQEMEYRVENPKYNNYSVYSHEGLAYSKEGRIKIKVLENV